MSSKITYRPIQTSPMSGTFLLTITKVERYRNTDGSLVIEGGGVGVVITFQEREGAPAYFEEDNKIVYEPSVLHQEVYWLSLERIPKLWNLLNVLDYDGMELDSKKLVGRKLWMVFKHEIGGGEPRCKVIDMSPENKKPNYPYLIVEHA